MGLGLGCGVDMKGPSLGGGIGLGGDVDIKGPSLGGGIGLGGDVDVKGPSLGGDLALVEMLTLRGLQLTWMLVFQQEEVSVLVLVQIIHILQILMMTRKIRRK